MTAILKFLRSEPAAIAGVIEAAVALAATFGFHLSADQIGAVLAALTALSGLIVRSQVTPTAKLPAPPPAPVPPAP